MKVVQVSSDRTYSLITLEIHNDSMLKLLDSFDIEAAVGREFLCAIDKFRRENSPAEDAEVKQQPQEQEQNDSELVPQEP